MSNSMKPMTKKSDRDSQIPLIENNSSSINSYNTYPSGNDTPIDSNNNITREDNPTLSQEKSQLNLSALCLPSSSTAEMKKQMFENVGARLAFRKSQFYKKRLIADCSLFFALLGIVIMIADTEVAISGVYGPEYGSNSIISMLVKSSITLTTAILLGFIVWYHKICVEVFMLDNAIDDWHLYVSASMILAVIFELLVCSVHPFPAQYFSGGMQEVNTKTGKLTNDTEAQHTIGPAFIDDRGPMRGVIQHIYRSPGNVVLGLLMFMRVYLVCRVIMLHSRIYHDASAQSLGALNRIHFNFRFVFKSLMNLYPERVLSLLIVILFIWASWALRACEIYHAELRDNFFNCMWLVAITFLSVGYGEIVPESYCGRSIAVLTGIFGAGCTALLVAILARKLEFSRAEKYVANFVMDVELDKRMRHAATDVIKQGWLVFRHKRAGSRDSALEHQRRLLRSIRKIRDLKNERRRLADNAVNLLEVHHSQNHLGESVKKIGTRVNQIEELLQKMDLKLDRIVHKR